MFRFPKPTATSRTPIARTATTFAVAVAAAAVAAPLAMLPAAQSASAYNLGVKNLYLAPATDSCTQGQLPLCTAGAGDGDANVLQVTQSIEDGYHRFNGLEGTSLTDGSLWLAVDMSAECRLGHSLTEAQIDSFLWEDDLDGLTSTINANGVGGGEWNPWPMEVSATNTRTMPHRRLAVNMPIETAFDHWTIAGYGTPDAVFAEGEAVIAERMAEGMSAAEARSLPFERHTSITIAGQVVCDYNGVIQASYFKRRFVEIPLTIEFLPAQVGAPVKDQHAGQVDLTGPARVTDAALSVVPDPADECRLHLSATIQTDRPTTVKYRFVNPHGQRSNTYSVTVDHTLTAFVSRSVAVPRVEAPDHDGDLVAPTGPGQIGGVVADVDDDRYTGTYLLEVVSPNPLQAADGFSVPFCTKPPTVVTGTVAGTAVGTFAQPADPTHG